MSDLERATRDGRHMKDTPAPACPLSQPAGARTVQTLKPAPWTPLSHAWQPRSAARLPPTPTTPGRVFMTRDDVRRQRKHSWSCGQFTERALGGHVPVPKHRPGQLLDSPLEVEGSPPPLTEGNTWLRPTRHVFDFLTKIRCRHC